jgi:glycosyltransferase involved in cell wall biosynthesis
MTSAKPCRVAVIMITMRTDGGAETLMLTLLNELRDSAVEFEVVVLREPRPSGRQRLAELGVPLRVFPAGTLLSPLRFVRLVKYLRKGRFDVIHTHLVGANILGLLAGAVLRIPVVVTLHNTETKADNHIYRGRLETWLIRRSAARVIAVGEHTRQAREPILAETPIHVLPNAVAPSSPPQADERTRLRTEIMSDPDRKLLLAVGRLTDQKAHHDMIDAVELLVDRRGDVELAIAGRGAREQELRELIATRGLDERVHLLGSRDDVRALMWSSDVFVMSSHWEGLPVAMLEALETGLPVVSTEVGDVPALVDQWNGRITPVNDIEAFAEAVSATLDALDRGAYARSDVRRVVVERFSASAWAASTCDHYTAAIGSDSSSEVSAGAHSTSATRI